MRNTKNSRISQYPSCQLSDLPSKSEHSSKKATRKIFNFNLEEKSFSWGIFIIMLGLLSISFGLILDAKGWLINFKISTFLNTVGTTILTMGFFQIILDLKSWRNYFEDRVVSVFKKQDFLDDLNEKELMEIQINALRAYFKDDSIAREGSFFEYYKRNLQRLIEEPYREDVHFSLVVHDDNSDSSQMSISLLASYVCRKGSDGYIQPNIFWDIHRRDVKSIQSFDIQLQHFEEKTLPEIQSIKFNEQSWYDDFNSKSEPHSANPQKCENCLHHCLINKEILDDSCSEIVCFCKNKGEHNEEIGFCYPLSEKYKNLDKLHVIVKAKYTVPIEDLRIFKIYFLSKNVTFSIHHPEGFAVDFYSFGVFKDLLMITQEECYYRHHYDSWMLPDNGIVWRLKRKGT